jgi:hypothetical protein
MPRRNTRMVISTKQKLQPYTLVQNAVEEDEEEATTYSRISPFPLARFDGT